MEVAKSPKALVLIYKQNATLLKALVSFLNDVRNLSYYVLKYFLDKFIARLEIPVSGFCLSFKTMHATMP
jgi:hypothetical protein